MSTSGIYSFAVTRDDLIKQAMLNIRRADLIDTLPPEETAQVAFVLNMLCKQWQGKSDFAPGLKVWTRKTGYRTLSKSTGTYALGPSALGWSNDMTVTKTTASIASPATSIQVASASGIVPGYVFGVASDVGEIAWTTVSSVAGLVVTVPALYPISLSATSGSAVYCYATSAQKPIAIETAWLRDDTSTDTPLTFMNVQDYSILSGKHDITDVGDPTSIYVEEGISSSTLYMDSGAAQDISKYIMLKYMESVQDFVNPLDNPHYPQEWYLALAWGLSKQICPMFGASWTPTMQENTDMAMMIARNKGAENSTLYFQPGQD